jgi:RND family efflux transporter MFP subunit
MNMKSLRTITLALGLTAALVAGCKRQEPSKPDSPSLPAATVRVQLLEAKKRVTTEEVVATVRAKLQARIEAKISGRIEQMRVVSGQSVKTGEVLIRLDAQEVRAKLDQAAAVHQQAESDLKRTTSLVERGAATRSEFEAVQTRARVAAAAVKEAETMLGYADILAPFNGVVSRKHADVGDLATPGKPLLEMEDPSALRVEANVPEALLHRIKPGQTLTVQVPTLTSALQGTVNEIAPSTDQASRTFLVKLDLPATPGLRAGSFARVAVPMGEIDGLRVPSEAVIQRGQLEYIFVVADGKAQLRLVKTGKHDGQEVELLAGAAAGDRVVISGAAQLRDGQPLQVQP